MAFLCGKPFPNKYSYVDIYLQEKNSTFFKNLLHSVLPSTNIALGESKAGGLN